MDDETPSLRRAKLIGEADDLLEAACARLALKQKVFPSLQEITEADLERWVSGAVDAVKVMRILSGGQSRAWLDAVSVIVSHRRLSKLFKSRIRRI
jgi:hypothetical protein